MEETSTPDFYKSVGEFTEHRCFGHQEPGSPQQARKISQRIGELSADVIGGDL
jgi:hypothetical protein